MTLRALVVCPEQFGDAGLPTLAGATQRVLDTFVQWVLSLSGEDSEVVLLAPQEAEVHLTGRRARAVELHAPTVDNLVEQAERAKELRAEDGFVLYWLGHGAGTDVTREQGLYYPAGGHSVQFRLGELRSDMCGNDRPGRQLWVVDACRAYGQVAAKQWPLGSSASVADPAWTGQLVLNASRDGEKARWEEGLGVYTRRLSARLAAAQLATLDLDRIEQEVISLEAEFRRDWDEGRVDQIPTHTLRSRDGGSWHPQDYRPHVLVPQPQIEALAEILDKWPFTPAEEAEVRAQLAHRHSALLHIDRSMPDLVPYLAGLPLPPEGDPPLSTFCAALVSHTRAAAAVRAWYAQARGTRDHLPDLRPLVSLPEEKTYLVIHMRRLTGATDDSSAVPGQQEEAHYRASAWLYTGMDAAPLDLPDTRRTRAQFPEVLQEAYGASCRFSNRLTSARVEFIVDRDLFHEQFGEYPLHPVDGGDAPRLAERNVYVLRDGYRHGPFGTGLIGAWAERAPLLRTRSGVDLLEWQDCPEPGDRARLRAAFAARERVGLVLPRGRARTNTVAGGNPAERDDVRTALNGGAVLAMWPGSCHGDCPLGAPDGHCRSQAIKERLRRALADRPLEDFPEIVSELGAREDAVGGMLRGATVIFDDPRRSPLAQTAYSVPVKGHRDESAR
ncbi:hypothetical protein AB0G49_11730 [Streptomyces longwoodensis]|uniref:hypothetical protein n=1 Tax=Streptomyces longwoodensis TaxID=68231 RepID=UPI0033C9557B